MAADGPGGVDIDYLSAALKVDGGRLQHLARRFSTTFRHLALTSTEQFLPTPITKLPTGNERGKFLAIDLGGTNLRVGFIELLGLPAAGDHGARSNSSTVGSTPRDEAQPAPQLRRTCENKWPIGEHLKMDQAEDLFIWIGGCIAEVVRDEMMADLEADDSAVVPEEITMGITFSFPMKQSSLNEATLMPMGKGFTIPPDLNLGKVLLAGYETHASQVSEDTWPAQGRSGALWKTRRPSRLPRLNVAAITNDTVATLASKAFTCKVQPDSRVVMGLIVGTGTNATVQMKLRDLERSKGARLRLPTATDPETVEVVVNTEWTINGSAGPLRELDFVSKWDQILDQASEAPGFQPFEYMTGGRYLGEIVRLIVLDHFTNVLGVADGQLPEMLRDRNALTTPFLATVIAKGQSGAALVSELSSHMAPPPSSTWEWTKDTAETIRQVANLVHVRSAGLIAAAIVGLLGCTGEVPLDESEKPAANGVLRSNPPSSSSLTTASTSSTNNKATVKDEKLVIACTGGVITHYPSFQQTCQDYIDEILRLEGGDAALKRIALREAPDGGIIGAGVLAGTVVDAS
ncbi:MAG: hypothetical protein M1838_004845 [Thelocarpon superellum]|nr:MAG: hypothetical protein M1838_004845 [Thelocarpon superellum]